MRLHAQQPRDVNMFRNVGWDYSRNCVGDKVRICCKMDNSVISWGEPATTFYNYCRYINLIRRWLNAAGWLWVCERPSLHAHLLTQTKGLFTLDALRCGVVRRRTAPQRIRCELICSQLTRQEDSRWRGSRLNSRQYCGVAEPAN